MVFSVPWLDGPTTLARDDLNTREASTLATYRLALGGARTGARRQDVGRDRPPVGRPARLTVGPGSSKEDYAAVGVDFRAWPRLVEQSARFVRCGRQRPRRSPAVLRNRRFSSQPRPAQPLGPPIWVGSWGSEAGLRSRFAAWLTAGWHRRTTRRRTCSAKRGRRCPRSFLTTGRIPQRFQCAGDDVVLHHQRPRQKTDAVVLNERIIPMRSTTGRDASGNAPGSARPNIFTEKLTATATAGVQRVYIWPVRRGPPTRAVLDRGTAVVADAI